MFKLLAKFVIWVIVAVAGTGFLIANEYIATPWRYTVNTTLTPGTSITLTQGEVNPEAEPVVLTVKEGETVSGTLPVDIGAPATILLAYFAGSIMAFMLKSRRKVETV